MNKANTVWFKWISVCCLLFWAMAISAEEDTVCAVVKIEIQQELTLERQAFEAQMKINNALDSLSLEDVNVAVNFEDDQGNTVVASSNPSATNAKFYIRVDSLEKINSITGSGSVAAATTAVIKWLIIPAPGAATDPAGTLFKVGATLSYSVGGEVESITVAPDTIRVKPLPLLTLDYFLQQHVFADDAFTPQIEPAEPFTLGVRVNNNGQAPAQNIKIDSAQPKIIENEQGLLIGFDIISGILDDQAAEPSLLLDFGSIEPESAKMGRWQMQTTLSGEFIEFTASFTHADELGGALTSILDATNTHFLIRDVLVDLPGRDTVLDFFADDGDALRVYESNTLDSVVTDQSASATLQLLSTNGSQSVYELTLPPSSGFIYAKLTDSYSGTYKVDQVLRADGKVIPLANAWFSKERVSGSNYNYFLNLFDVHNSAGQYFITVSPLVEVPVAPVLQFIGDWTVTEGEQLGFLVQASDGNNTIPTISADPLPSGSLFSLSDTQDQVATYIFDWIPSQGQAGDYEVAFTASDGQLTHRRVARIKVNPAGDSDNDGMDDEWELANFGTLDRDGTGDFDGDGISDLAEFNAGTNPRDFAPVSIPGRVQAEWTHSYFDTTLGNSGDAPCGVDDVDAQITTDVDGECEVYLTEDGEWTEYRVSVSEAGWFDLTVRAYSPDETAIVFVEVDGVDISGSLNIPQSISQTYSDLTLPIEMVEGVHHVRVMFESGETYLNYLDFAAASGPENQPPVVEAGADTNAVVNQSFTLGGSVEDDGVALPLSVQWTPVDNVIFTDASDPNSTVVITQPGQYQLTLVAGDSEFTVSDTVVITVATGTTNAAPVVNAGSDVQIAFGTTLELAGVVTDDGFSVPLTYQWQAAEGVVFVDEFDLNSQVTFNAAGQYTLTLTASDTEFTVSDSVVVTVLEAPTNTAPIVDAGSDLQTKVGQAVTLNASVVDDGITLPLLVEWQSQVGVVFTDVNSLSPVVTFANAGVYELTLEVSDTEFAVTDTVTVTVVEGQINLPPTVDAGADIDITIGQPLALAATVSDDGLTPLTVLWQALDNVVFDDPSSLNSGVSFTEPGDYVLTLTADDTEFVVTDTVTVTVTNIATNTAPMISVGSNRSIAFGQSINLQGQMQDDGLSLPVTVAWTGPSGVTFDDRSSLTPTVSFDGVGQYVLTLTVDDVEFQVVDTLTIDVIDPNQQQSILFMVGNSDLSVGDALTLEQLEQLGYQVVLAQDSVFDYDQLPDVAGIVISSSVSYSSIDNRFRNLDIPIVSFDRFQFVKLGMSPSEGDIGINAAWAEDVNLTGRHSLTAGYSGRVDFPDDGSLNIRWGKTGGDAIVAGHFASDPSQAAIFGYEKASLMADGLLAPARRVGLFFDQDIWAGHLTDLFASAVSWSIADPNVNQLPFVSAGEKDLIEATVGVDYHLRGRAADDLITGPFTAVWSSDGPADFVDTTDPNSTVRFSQAGQYQLTLTVSDGEFTVVDTIDVNVSDSPKVLFVVSDAELLESEQLTLAQLEAFGYQVAVVVDEAVSAEDSNGAAAIVLAGTVSSYTLSTTFKETPVPLISFNRHQYQQLGMTAAEEDIGLKSGWENLILLQGQHTLTGGYKGQVDFPVVGGSTISWAIPGSAAIIAAKLDSDPQKAAIFGYEKHSILADGSASPARRVGLFFSQNLWSGQLSHLFEAALDWATADDQINQAPVSIAGEQVIETSVGVDFNLEGRVSDDLKSGPLTITWSSDGPASFVDNTDPTSVVNFSSAGQYHLTLTVTDGSQTVVDTVTIEVSEAKKVLYIVNELPLSADETLTVEKLNLLGYDVVTAVDDQVVAADANGNAAILVGPSASAFALSETFKLSPVPLVSQNHHQFIQLGLATASGLTTTWNEQVEMTGHHSLTAGLSGEVDIPVDSTIRHATTAGDAIVAAHIVGDTSKATVFGYDKDTQLADGTTATARRAGLFAPQDKWSDQTVALLGAALTWAIADPTVDAAPVVAIGDGNNFLTSAGVEFRLEGRVSDDGLSGPLTITWSTGSPAIISDASSPISTMTISEPGVHELTLTVSDGVHSVTEVQVIEVSQFARVLLVVSDLTLSDGDAMTANILEDMGYAVVTVDDDAVKANDANGFGVIVLSESASSSILGTTFAESPVPLVNFNKHQSYELGMASSVASVGNISGESDQIQYVGRHSLTAGYSGYVDYPEGSSVSNVYVVPGGDAIVAAHFVSDSSKAAVYGYDEGGLLADGTTLAPARRAGLFFQQTNWTEHLMDILDAAMAWATANPTENSSPLVIAGNRTIKTSVDVNFLLEARVADDYGPLTVNWSADSAITIDDVTDPASVTSVDTAGTYVMTLTVNDGQHTVTDTVTVEVSASPLAYFVAGDVNLGVQDSMTVNQLETLGYTVVIEDDSAATLADTNGVSVVILSDTVGAMTLGSRFKLSRVPLISFDRYQFYAVGMAASVQDIGFESASSADVTMLNNHALSAGIVGEVDFPDLSSIRIQWAYTGGDAIVAGHITGDSTKAAVFGYEKNTELADGTDATSRRVGLFIDMDDWSGEIPLLFEAALDWTHEGATQQ